MVLKATDMRLLASSVVQTKKETKDVDLAEKYSKILSNIESSAKLGETSVIVYTSPDIVAELTTFLKDYGFVVTQIADTTAATTKTINLEGKQVVGKGKTLSEKLSSVATDLNTKSITTDGLFSNFGKIGSPIRTAKGTFYGNGIRLQISWA